MRRVRLVISRPEVPHVRILWPLDTKISQNPRYSVYDLLSDVSAVIPLDNWNLGLEDYVAEHAGCELLHFMPIGELIGDNDELTIRPLTRTEAKEYLKGGRRQISTTGRKLQDGVPIGRAFITPAPDRPRIEGGEPPAKRRRTRRNQEPEDEESESIDLWGPVVGDSTQNTAGGSTSTSVSRSKRVRFEEEESQDTDTSSALALADLEDDEEDDDESDDDFNPDASEDEDEDTSSDEEEEEEGDGHNVEEDVPTTKRGPEDPEKDIEAAPKQTEEKLDKSDDSDSESSSSDSSSDSDESSVADSSDDGSMESSELEASSFSGFDSSDSDSDSSSESDESDSDSQSEPEEVSSKVVTKKTKAPPPPPVAPGGIPFEGTATTKSRNQRRRETKALAKLIKNQILPVGSTKEDMRKLREQGQPLKTIDSPAAAPSASSDSVTISSGTISTTSRKDAEIRGTGSSGNGSQTDANLSSTHDFPMYTPMEPLEVTVEQMEITIDVPATSPAQSEQPPQSDEVSSSPVGNRRHRPVASDAAKRLILGGLGLRKPRNQAEEDKLRADWKKANSKYVGNKGKGFLDSMVGKEGVHSRYDENGEAATEVPKVDQVAKVTDPDAWKKQMRVFAVECNPNYYDEDGGDRLATPSFPFDQRQLFRNTQWSTTTTRKNKKKQKKGRSQQLEAAQEESWDASYYDDSSMQVDSAQRSAPVERSTQGEGDDDDLPPVPSNLSDYPMLQQPVLPESVIVFTRLVLDKAIPQQKQATARVLSVNGSNIKYQLAKRDRPKAVYNALGERVFGPFHMPGTEEDTDNGIEEQSLDDMYDGHVIKEGAAPAADLEVAVEEPESERVPETVRGSQSLDQDDNGDQSLPQDEDEDLPMLEPVEEEEESPELEDDDLSRLSGAVQQSSFQSSSFAEPPFQTNGSCGYGHDSEHDTDPEPEGDEDSQDIAKDSVPSTRPMHTTSDIVQEEDFESSAEAYRFEDALTQDIDAQDGRPPTTSSQLEGTLFQTAPESHSSPRSDPLVQVRGTPDPALLRSPSARSSPSINNNWDLSVDISALEPAEVDKIKKMVKVKEECPEDTELLRQALKPFHHPSEATPDDANITVDISSPASLKIKRERLSTEEALVSSPIAALQDITERSANNNPIDLDAQDDYDGGADVEDSDHAETGTGSRSLGKDESPPAPPALTLPRGFIPTIGPIKKSDGTFQRRRKTGALFRNRPSIDQEDQRRIVSAPAAPIAIKQEFHENSAEDDDDFAIPSTMPVRSLTNGKTAISGRNEWRMSTKLPDFITLDSDDDAPPRASLQVIGGEDAPVIPGKPKFSKKMVMKRRHIPRRSESVDPESSQWRPISSQQ
ncbi:hypothetical protein Dda_0550 [Drechslerella dactyloides]|uniref:DUF7357 domain-containing protein n=1 Tax=Drechslerella dactyloides TaxID=74499 RepID=A0AAD6J4T1_DREDA|nr:hypothetical protein Dda_0550 [Drechslerella dactyloides]